MAIIHFAPIRLGVGSIVEPGNFGRLLRTHQAFILTADQKTSLATGAVAREFIFEVERLKNYSALPSRMACTFACPTEHDAEAYGSINNANGMQVRHEVEPVNPKASMHTASLTHCYLPTSGAFLPIVQPRAEAYWAGTPGEPTHGRESLFGCGLRIIKCLD